MPVYRQKAEQAFGPIPAADTKNAPIPDTVPDIGLIPNILGDINLVNGTFTYGSYQADPAEYDIKNETYEIYWRGHWLKLCEQTKTDIEEATGKKFESLYDQIKAEITANEFSGNPVLDLVGELEKWFGDVNKWKARRIAVTESNRISNAGYLADTDDDETVVGYEFLLSDDACELCQSVGVAADGQPRQVAKGNAFAQKLDGDPYYATILAPPVHPNCRCTIVPVLDFEPTRFSPPAKVDKGAVADPGGPPLIRPPLVDIEGDVPVNDPQPDPVPPKKPRKPRATKPKVKPGAEPIPGDIPLADRFVEIRKTQLQEEWKKYRATWPDRFYIDTVEDSLNHYMPLATAKMDAIDEFIKRYKPAPVQLSAAAKKAFEKKAMEQYDAYLIKEGKSTNIPDRQKQNALKYHRIYADLAGEAENKINKEAHDTFRDQLFQLLELPEEDRVHITKDTGATFKPTGFNTDHTKTIEKVVHQYSRILAHNKHRYNNGPKKDRVKLMVEAENRKGTSYQSRGTIAVFGKHADETLETTLIHELGHFTAWHFSKDSMREVYSYDQKIAKSKTKYRDKLESDVAKNATEMVKGKFGQLSESYLLSNSKYVQKSYLRNGKLVASEFPSVLMEMMYNDPVVFFQKYDRDLIALALGFLDGSLR